jgi:pyruvate/2-oxoglutarate/acetoin dehydrogenase E1 component
VAVRGDDVTLVGISYMLVECLRAERYLADAGIAAEVIDPIWLSPLDTGTIVDSVRRTGRLLVVDNGWTTCGASAEIVARVVEALQGERTPQVCRLGFAPVTCPTTPSLERHFYPEGRTIAAAARDLIEGRPSGWMPDERADLREIDFRGPF